MPYDGQLQSLRREFTDTKEDLAYQIVLGVNRRADDQVVVIHNNRVLHYDSYQQFGTVSSYHVRGICCRKQLRVHNQVNGW